MRRSRRVEIEPLEGRTLLSAAVIAPVAALPAITVSDSIAPGLPFTGPLVRDSAGNLYGVQPQGGSGGFGTVFEIDATSHSLSTLYTFDGTAGITPIQIALDSTGNIFGITENNAGAPGSDPVNQGTLFELPASSPASLSTLYTFADPAVGEGVAALVLDPSNNVDVLTSQYTAQSDTIVQFAAGTAAPSVLGTVPVANPTQPGLAAVAESLTLANGNFYGTTLDGGTNNDGTVFELPAGQTAGTMLASFDGSTTGKSPNGPPLVDAAGNVYGVSQYGGAGGFGAIYKFTARTGSLGALASFDGAVLGNPVGDLVADGNGNLFGEASYSANSFGGVFSINTQSGLLGLQSFPDDGSVGGTPTAGLVDAGNNTYYGYDTAGSASNAGEVFSLSNPNGGGLTNTGGDLSATISRSTLPATAVSATIIKGNLSLTVSNTSATKLKTSGTISVYATTTGSIDSSSKSIATVTRTLKIKAGKTAKVNFRIKKLSLPAGTYTLLTEASDASGAIDAATGPTITVADPFVSLAATVGDAAPAAVKPGRPFTFKLTIVNSGNVDSVGPATFTIGLSTDGSTLSQPLPPTTIKSLKIKHGTKPTTVKLKTTLPADQTAGKFFIVVTGTQGDNTFTAVSAAAFTVA